MVQFDLDPGVRMSGRDLDGPAREFPERLLAIEAAKQVAFADTEDVIVAVFDARREVVFCVDRGEIPAQV